MKIRAGFVSNSSSSSFICDVCGEEVSGMDMCFSETDLLKCTNDHLLCAEHKLGAEDAEEDEDLEYNHINAKNCPVCQLQALKKEEAFRYLLKRAGLTPTTLLAEVQEKFSNFEEYEAYWGQK